MTVAPRLMDRESVRNSYRPTNIKVLFVGESPPANENAFFYFGGRMAKHMERAFSTCWKRQFASSADFLNFFKQQGCYLDDLSHEPVNTLLWHAKREAVNASIETFSKRLLEFNPEHVIALLKSIETPVLKAVRSANLTIPVNVVSCPGQGNLVLFRRELSEIFQQIYFSS
jgi:hypothetical protein